MSEDNPSTEPEVSEQQRPYSILAFVSLFIGVVSFISMGIWFYSHPEWVQYVCIGGIIFAVVAGCRLVLAKRRGWAGVIAGGVLCIVSLYLLPVMQRAKCLSDEIVCFNQLEKIGKAIKHYQTDYEGMNPSDLQILVDMGLLDGADLICPVGGDPQGLNTYIYRGSDLDASAADDMVLAYDRFGNHDWGGRAGGSVNILFASGYPKYYDESHMWDIIDEDNNLRAQRGLPEKSMEMTPRFDREGNEIISPDSKESTP